MRHILDGTIWNGDIRWNVDEDMCKESEPVKHLKGNLNLKFKWETLLPAPENYR